MKRRAGRCLVEMVAVGEWRCGVVGVVGSVNMSVSVQGVLNANLNLNQISVFTLLVWSLFSSHLLQQCYKYVTYLLQTYRNVLQLYDTNAILTNHQ